MWTTIFTQYNDFKKGKTFMWTTIFTHIVRTLQTKCLGLMINIVRTFIQDFYSNVEVKFLKT
jgi:hypothetical protein